MRLIAVVMKSKSTHYTDTKAMLDYGYALAEAGALSGGQAGQLGEPSQARALQPAARREPPERRAVPPAGRVW